MKKEDLFEALGEINEEHIKNARFEKVPRKVARLRCGLAAAAALVVLTVALGIPFMKNHFSSPKGEAHTQGGFHVNAEYPEPTAQQMSADEFYENDAHWKWWDAYRKLTDASAGMQKGLSQYYTSLMEHMLISEDENTVCSPLNIYIAFAMLAEVSDGATRQQILDMLDASDIAKLREQVHALWLSNYVDTPILKSLLANSLWLDQATVYNEDTLKTLAEYYYASSFSGVPGSEEMDEALRQWTDENTGNLLTEYTKEMHIQPDTVMEILSTIYYKAAWVDTFYANNTAQETFHGVKGDTTVDMMHRTDMMGVYRTDAFTAVNLNLSDSGSMIFYLPNDGCDVNSLAGDPAILSAVQYDENENWSSPLVHLSVPKFSISAKTDLKETMIGLGVIDALDPGKADFTPLTTDRDDLYVSKAEHAALVEVDEDGVTGAAYTELAIAEGAALPDEEIDFVLDRPFMFLVTGRDGSVLFSGIVRNIE